jgi:spiro-SPASM protein
MNVLTVLYGASLAEEALEPVFAGKSALALAAERALGFPGASKSLFFGKEGETYPCLPGQVERVLRPRWTKKTLLEELDRAAGGFDLIFYAWADCPFLDRDLAQAMAQRHREYAAEYSNADGWPYGFSPEILAPGLPRLLTALLADDDGPVSRDALFSIIQKDINAFDIETEISPVDLRGFRLSLCADSRRNLRLLVDFAQAGLEGTSGAEKIIGAHPEFLRTLPAFFPIQVSVPCPQSCPLCPYPRVNGSFGPSGPSGHAGGAGDFMAVGDFTSLLDKIIAFAGDGVIDLSLWGELALHPEREALIGAVLERPELSLIVETAGLSWSVRDLENIARTAAEAAARKNGQAPLSWIVSLDAFSPQRYEQVRGRGAAEAAECARLLAELFPSSVYVQAIRVKDAEDDIEQFYRYWKEKNLNVIIQKYDSFCGTLDDLGTADLSPLRRNPCWHIMRDFPVLIDGTIPLCREDIEGKFKLGNALHDDLEAVWKRGEARYLEHAEKNYTGPCAVCDEYYTYNF